ncbi:peroxiredoxin family protein [Candidatus Magnetominusculus dajiuhuensis]|uniref:peroxiredoxin family protein n=1 Tax=Candidatus Magnetominusculus dajiuhuensis TaxID=3137712 RepID=UPI003B42ED6D
MIKYWTLILILLITTTVGAVPPAPWESDEIIGKAAPDFTLKTLDGKNFSLSTLKGKTVLINFWATWCPPCVEELPSMNKLYLKYKQKGFEVVAISLDSSTTKVKKYIAKNPLSFIVLLDTDKRVAKKLYKVSAQPTTYLISSDGKIIRKFFGSVDWTDEVVQKEIEGLLK